MNRVVRSIILSGLAILFWGGTTEVDRCAQPSPAEMAKTIGVKLPPQPWHVADLWWNFQKPEEHFEKLEMEVTIDRDIPSTYNLYISPCGLARISGMDFYGGLQTNINGWASKENHERVFPGKGAIFSRWSADKKVPVELENTRPVKGGLVESAGYEGQFASVRAPLNWGAGTYLYQIVKGEKEILKEKPQTWFHCRVIDPQGKAHEIGSLRFEGEDFTYWPHHAAFVEVYSTGKISSSSIPKVNITFGYPRINGKYPALKNAMVAFPRQGTAASPACAHVSAKDEKVEVTVGPIFQRKDGEWKQNLPVKTPTTQPAKGERVTEAGNISRR